MTSEEQAAAGINQSRIHVDFVIGSADLTVVGVDAEGNEKLLLVDGEWAIAM